MTVANTVPIGDVVEELLPEFPDISISKIRYLETQGLITPDRAPSGYRRYSDGHVDQLRWVLTQQRDNFLPLRVIKEKLSVGDFDAETDEASDGARHLKPPTALRATSVTLELSAREMMERSGLTAEGLADLERFGLVNPVKGRSDPAKIYGGDDLLVARVAYGFAQHGIEARHLRPWKVAVDREAGLVDQRLASIAPDPDQRRAVISDLVRLGAELRSVLLRRALHEHL